jgi:hypothetical protein
MSLIDLGTLGVAHCLTAFLFVEGERMFCLVCL